jgi:DNA-binding transcriptional LysR family regulator
MFGRGLYASNQYLKRRGVSEEPEDLTKHDGIPFLTGRTAARWELHRGRERRIVEVRGPCSEGSVGFTAQLAREHLGIARMLEFLAKHPSDGAGLGRVLPEWEAVPAHYLPYTCANCPGANQEMDRVDEGAFLKKSESAECF